MDRTANLDRFVFILIPIFSILIFGCSTLQELWKEDASSATKRSQYDQDEIALASWQKLVRSKKYDFVVAEIPKFIEKNPLSHHWYGMMFTLGKAQEGLEDWNGAIETYRQIIERSTDRQLEYVAQAFFQIALCYEVLLENEKALAALGDASRLHAYLPLEINLAEIPAKTASLYARLNQNSLAMMYTERAEKGINKLRVLKKGSDPEWLGRTLVEMGRLHLTQIDSESFQQNIRSLIKNQRYLVQAIELQDGRWSKEAQGVLLNTYASLWSFIETFKGGSSSDWEADLVQEAFKRSNYLSEYLECIENLKTFRAPEDLEGHSQTAPLYEAIATFETKALALLRKEMLKRPWHLISIQKESEPGAPLGGAKTLPLLLDETPQRPEFIPTQLPKKKLPTR